MSATIEIPLETISIEDLEAEHPHAICTPMLGTERALPPKACPVAQELQWSWSTATREIEIDGAHVRIGERAGSYPITGGPIRYSPGDTITLYAKLAQLGL